MIIPFQLKCPRGEIKIGVIHTLSVGGYNVKYSQENGYISVTIPNFAFVFPKDQKKLGVKLHTMGWRRPAIAVLINLLSNPAKWKSFQSMNKKLGK